MIHAIYIAPQSGGPQQALESARVVAGKGIVGDRNFGLADCPGQNVTFVEVEEIEAFASRCGYPFRPDMTRRNILTLGVRLNELVGREFVVGEVRFRGVELCEPCATLGASLATDRLSRQEVVRAFLHRGGLRADLLNDGELSPGMPFSYPK